MIQRFQSSTDTKYWVSESRAIVLSNSPYICLDFINNIYLAHLAVYGQKHLEAPGRVAYRNYNLM